MSTSTQAPRGRLRVQIDPRGARFAATVTALVLAAALLAAPSTATVLLLAVQVAVFAIGASAGVQHTPYAWLFRTLVQPRLYQLLREPGEIKDRTVEITFLDACVEAYVFTFG